jgi:hypothetical protein
MKQGKPQKLVKLYPVNDRNQKYMGIDDNLQTTAISITLKPDPKNQKQHFFYKQQRYGGLQTTKGFQNIGNIQETEVPQHQCLHIENSHPIHLRLRAQPQKKKQGVLKRKIYNVQ